MPRVAAVLAALAVVLVVTACTEDDTDDGAGPGTSTTSTTAGDGTTTTTTLPGGELVRCRNPEGFEVGHPEGWWVNEAGAVGPCSQFNPEPVELPVGTDRRVSAITAFVDPVPFEVAADADAGGTGTERATTAVDGQRAVRLAYETTADALYGAGVPVTVYMVDLGTADDGTGRTLFLDTVGLSGFDYERNVVVLDRMARTVELTLDGLPGGEGVVAVLAGDDGADRRVLAEVRGEEVCLRVAPDGTPECQAPPAADEVVPLLLTDPDGPWVAGLAGERVFRVTAETEGDGVDVLPAPVDGTDVRAYAAALRPDEVEALTWADIAGTDLGGFAE